MNKKSKEIEIKGNENEIVVVLVNKQDFISLTDITKRKTEDTGAVIGN